jgi:hypothetical protein
MPLPNQRLAEHHFAEHGLAEHGLADFEHRVLPRILVPVLATLLVLLAFSRPSHAQSNTFVISDNEGYGIMDCLSGNKSCGRIVADAWCEAHGLGAARAFGPASDITGVTQVASRAATQITPGSVVVSCGD